MPFTWLLLNASYLLYTTSAVFKDMLTLRSTLLGATFLYIAYGIVDPNWSVFFWNIPVALLHSYAIWQLLKARRGIVLDDEALAIRTLIFDDLDRVSFNTMWHLGEQRTVNDEMLIAKGEEVTDLMLILDGEVDVEVESDFVVRLSHYRLIGEMSSLSDSVASATVRAKGEVRLRTWNKAALAACSAQNPAIELAMLRAMGQEVARKMN